MRAITVTATNRPQYLSRLIEDLAQNDLEGWELFIQVEPDCPKTMAYLRDRSMLYDADDGELGALDGWRISLNPTRLGVRDNPYALLNEVFGKFDAEYVIYLEEDLTISADVTRLAEWYVNKETTCVGRIPPTTDICLNLFNPAGAENVDPRAIGPCKKFSSLGFVIDRHQWFHYFQPNWYKQENGWDWSINSLMEDDDKFCFQPWASRSNHTGREGGAHVGPEFHDRYFGSIDAYRGPPPDKYMVVGERPKPRGNDNT